MNTLWRRVRAWFGRPAETAPSETTPPRRKTEYRTLLVGYAPFDSRPESCPKCEGRVWSPCYVPPTSTNDDYLRRLSFYYIEPPAVITTTEYAEHVVWTCDACRWTTRTAPATADAAEATTP
jgi:hypothetical protein